MERSGASRFRRPAEGRRERRKRELRERIFEAARALFAAHGFEGTTVEKIAAAADVAPATFFNHFQSKQALLGLMAEEVVDYLEGLIDDALRHAPGARERLLGLAETAGERIAENQGVARHVVLELVRTREQPGDTAPYLSRVHGPLEALVREGQERGEVRRDREAAFLARMVVGMLNVPIARWLSDPETPIGPELRSAAEFAWEAIRAPAGPDASREES